jgi:hypothetical protein
MSIKKPLVLGSDGLLQQLQAGDSLPALVVGRGITINAAGDLSAGSPCYVSGDGTCGLAMADSVAGSYAVGVPLADIANGTSGEVIMSGPVVLTTGQWDAITGGSGGLSAGSKYFLSDATAGHITSTHPTTTGHTITAIGTALTATVLLVRIAEPIVI